MKTSHLTLCLFLLFFIAACQSQDEIPVQPETQRRIVSSADIPQFTSSLLDQLGLRNGGKGFSVYTEGNELGVAIDWDKVKQLIDTTGKQTYTFAIKDQDNDPKTFYNLIFQLTAENEPYQPYLMKYTMDDAFAVAYYSGQSDFSSFQGSVKKIRVQGFGSSPGNSYNDDGGEVLVGEDCPGDTQINNNSQGTTGSGGGSSGNPPVGGFDPEDDWMCEVFIQETDWWTCVSGGGSTYCRITETTYEITYENCGSGSAMSSSDDDGFCQPTDDNIPIIEPDIVRLMILEDLIEQDSTLLINILCSDLEKWQSVGAFKPRAGVVDKIEQLQQNYTSFFTGDFDIQTLEKAKGTVVNMDFFPITVESLPSNHTAESFLNLIRLNFNSFIDTDYSSFSAYESVNTGHNEAAIWNSSDPGGAIIHISIPGETKGLSYVVIIAVLVGSLLLFRLHMTGPIQLVEPVSLAFCKTIMVITFFQSRLMIKEGRK